MSQLLKLEDFKALFQSSNRNYSQGCNGKYACDEQEKEKKKSISAKKQKPFHSERMKSLQLKIQFIK